MATAGRGFVFISFKTEEREHARHLKAALEARGHQVWWQETIQCGQEWHGEIDTAVTTAGCIVVLWSSRALQSPWVRHEASQAVARGIYAPARVELVKIDAPFDRLQATDLIGWDGKLDHPGFVSLLAKVTALLPPEASRLQRAGRWISKMRGTLIAGAIAFAALLLLGFLAYTTSKVTRELDRTLHPIHNLRVMATLKLPAGIPQLATYRARLLRGLSPEAIAKGLPPGTEISVSNELKQPEIFLILPGSSLWPDMRKETFASYALGYANFTMSFFGKDSKKNFQTTDRIEGDLNIEVGTSDSPEGLQLEYDLIHDEFALRAAVTPDPAYWNGDALVSVNDLMDSTVRLDVQSVMVMSPGDPASIAEFAAVRAELRLDWLDLLVSGHTLSFPGPGHLFVGPNRPSNSDAVKELTRTDGLRSYVVAVSSNFK